MGLNFKVYITITFWDNARGFRCNFLIMVQFRFESTVLHYQHDFPDFWTKISFLGF
jgi:hypothetical protein